MKYTKAETLVTGIPNFQRNFVFRTGNEKTKAIAKRLVEYNSLNPGNGLGRFFYTLHFMCSEKGISHLFNQPKMRMLDVFESMTKEELVKVLVEKANEEYTCVLDETGL